MQELLGIFPKKFSQVGKNSKKYFDKDGNLKRINELRFWSLEETLRKKYKISEYKQLSELILMMLNP